MMCVANKAQALRELVKAFRACPHEFAEMQAGIVRGEVCLYRIKAAKHDLFVAAEYEKDTLFLWGVSGVGLQSGILELKNIARRAGLTYLEAVTHFPEVARLARRFGTQNGDLSSAVQSLKLKV
ncbi:hypothetical protein ST37_01745 (plasmid) [Vibrio sp. qd031]|uniref:hypothetical protein n=1 Tax=Vibrio sp. qd031 TaxID=1603038 RepID=UPI000A1070B7|nr:hypothetical protein [Vibrio sp. qd031]ORT52519.1 hypothetical protein ST37_01745 [Vibrio sp. qd031]